MDHLTFTPPFIARAAAAALERNGCILIRNLLTPALFASARSGFAALREVQRSFVAAPPADIDYAAFEDMRALESAGVVMLQSHLGAAPWRGFAQTVAGAVVQPLRAIVENYFHENFVVPIGYVMARQHAGVFDARNTTYVAYHQDIDFIGDGFESLNCWVPLDDCGEDAPGLELIPVRLRENLNKMLPASVPPVGLRFKSYEAQVIETRFADAPRFRPVMRVGDVLIFSECTLHRTHHVAGITRARQSMEVRVFPASNLPPIAQENTPTVIADPA